MGIRTGTEYLEGLRDGREVYLDGRRVDDVTTEPVFGNAAHTFARLIDLQHDADYRDRLTFEVDGERVSGSYFWPVDRVGAEWRRGVTQTLARQTGGLFGRAPEYVPTFLLGMLDIKEDFGRGDPDYVRRIESYAAQMMREDKVLSHTFVDVQANPGTPVDETAVPRMVGKNGDGITVRGAKTIATMVPHSDECLVGVLPRAGLQDHHVLYFSTPVNAPGLRIVAREALGGGDEFDHPVSMYGDENDCIVIFDDLFVPWERVFSPIEGPAFAAQTFPRITEWAHWDILCRFAVKAEVMVGVVALIPEMIGRFGQPQAREAAGELVRYLTAVRAFLHAAEERGHMTPNGFFMPDPVFVTAGRAYAVEFYRTMTGYIQDVAGQGLITPPTGKAFDNEVIGPVLEEMLDTPNWSARDRTRVARFAWDLVGSGFGGRQTMFELFNALPWTAQRSTLVDRFDFEPYKELALATAGIASLDSATSAVEQDVGAFDVDYDRIGVSYTVGAKSGDVKPGAVGPV